MSRAGLAAACALLALPASAQSPAADPAAGYPTKPIRVIVAVPAGGAPDVFARMVQPGMSAALGQQLVIDNRGGAGGAIGTEMGARAVPDGYTLLVASTGPLTILPHIHRKAPYDTLRDFAPVSLIASNPYLLIAHPSVPAKSVKEVIALAKSEPGKLNFASAGNGSTNHLAFELFKHMASVDITHIPYKGAPQAVTDLLGGRANFMLNSVAPVLQHIRAERLRLLAVSSEKRTPLFPDTPTIIEAGVPGYVLIAWFGMVAPAKTPKPVIARVHEALVKALREPALRAQFEAQAVDAGGISPEAFGALIRSENEKYARAVKVSGAKVD